MELKGGLGNQLFQYYAGFYSSNISNRILIFDERQVKNEIFFKSRIQSGMQINGLKQVKGIENIYLRLVGKILFCLIIIFYRSSGEL